MTITYIQAGEIMGVEELILKQNRRQFSLKVSSDEVILLYLGEKDFIERLYKPHPAFKHLLCERLELQMQFHNELQ